MTLIITVNLLIAVIASLAILIGWHYLYEKPQMQKVANSVQPTKQNTGGSVADVVAKPSNTTNIKEQLFNINTQTLKGQISNRGLIFSDLLLKKYKTETDDQSSAVTLLAPNVRSLFIEYTCSKYDMPDINSMWRQVHDNKTLKSDTKLSFTWKSDQGMEFIRNITIDENYLIIITDNVTNKTGNSVDININIATMQKHKADLDASGIVYQGPIAYVNNTLKEVSYEKIRDKKRQHFKGKLDWFGFSDQYWLTGFIPDQEIWQSQDLDFSYDNKENTYKLSSKAALSLKAGESRSVKTHMYVGPKIIEILDQYEQQLNISHLDKAVDFGILYYVTKPMFYLLTFLNKYLGSFALTLVILTILIKLLLMPLAMKSTKAMSRMKDLSPKIKALQEQYSDDKIKLNEKMMELYKKEKINPAAGCLPMIVQIPIAFGLYKVLYISIEMRHEPFWGWISDLSAADPTTLFNLFGLIPWQPPEFLMLGHGLLSWGSQCLYNSA